MPTSLSHKVWNFKKTQNWFGNFRTEINWSLQLVKINTQAKQIDQNPAKIRDKTRLCSRALLKRWHCSAFQLITPRLYRICTVISPAAFANKAAKDLDHDHLSSLFFFKFNFIGYNERVYFHNDFTTFKPCVRLPRSTGSIEKQVLHTEICTLEHTRQKLSQRHRSSRSKGSKGLRGEQAKNRERTNSKNCLKGH